MSEPRAQWRSSTLLSRARYGVAMVAVVAALLAVSAFWKGATCGCGGSGLPYQTIAIAAAMVCVVAVVLYAAIRLTSS